MIRVHSFAHISDCHIGAWRNLVLRDLNVKSFEKAMDRCVEEDVDFIIVSGDLFDINIPDLSSVKRATEKMKEVRDRGIPIYLIYGSHDYSTSAVSLVDILQSAGLFRKVVDAGFDDDRLILNFFRDPKTGAKLTGISGRQSGLERGYFAKIDRDKLQREEGFKIFLFHSAVDEFKPLDYMYTDSVPLSEIPTGFNYCAGGHIHKRVEQDHDEYGRVIWPGALFGSNFKDLEDSALGEKRGFYKVEFDDEVRNLEFLEVKVCEIVYHRIDAERKTAKQVDEEVKDFATRVEGEGKVVLFKVSGNLSAGQPSDIEKNVVLETIRQKQPLVVVPNWHGLIGKKTEIIRVTGEDKTEIENKLFQEWIGSYKIDPSTNPNARYFLQDMIEGEAGLKSARNLLEILKVERQENEKVHSFKERVWREASSILKLGEIK